MKRAHAQPVACDSYQQQLVKRHCIRSSAESPCNSQSSLVASAHRLPAGQQQLLEAKQAGAAQEQRPHMLDQQLALVLRDADAALHLTTSAMTLATQMCVAGACEHVADRALLLAETALATTMQQLRRAHTLVACKLHSEQMGNGAALRLAGCWQGAPVHCDDDDLQDTCSSSAPAAC